MPATGGRRQPAWAAPGWCTATCSLGGWAAASSPRTSRSPTVGRSPTTSTTTTSATSRSTASAVGCVSCTRTRVRRSSSRRATACCSHRASATVCWRARPASRSSRSGLPRRTRRSSTTSCNCRRPRSARSGRSAVSASSTTGRRRRCGSRGDRRRSSAPTPASPPRPMAWPVRGTCARPRRGHRPTRGHTTASCCSGTWSAGGPRSSLDGQLDEHLRPGVAVAVPPGLPHRLVGAERLELLEITLPGSLPASG